MEKITDAIILLLNQRIGLDHDTVGRGLVEHALKTRIAALKLPGIRDYQQRLEASPDELQQLVEAVVVPETWFFRQAESFADLVRFVLNEWLPGHADQVLQILSVPCSTGEEPYTIVMALMDAGFPLHRLQVDAVDISHNALQHARAGVYRPYSFRNKDQRFRDQYFVEEPTGYRIKDALREPVRFQQGNALEMTGFGAAGKYDVIFCRNLLIYLDAPAQQKVISNLMYCLHREGRLFSAPAEYSLYRESEFQSLGVPGASKFHKPVPAGNDYSGPVRVTARSQSPAVTKVMPGRKAHVPMPPPAVVPPRVSPGQAAAPQLIATPSQRAFSGDEEDLLQQAARLADEGRLLEAITACERHIGESGETAGNVYLLGLIKDTLNEPVEAEKLYRKALYLDPNHIDALLHLASVRADAGDDAQAKLLRARARRAQERES